MLATVTILLNSTSSGDTPTGDIFTTEVPAGICALPAAAETCMPTAIWLALVPPGLIVLLDDPVCNGTFWGPGTPEVKLTKANSEGKPGPLIISPTCKSPVSPITLFNCIVLDVAAIAMIPLTLVKFTLASWPILLAVFILAT